MSLTPGEIALGDQCKAESDRLVDLFIEAAKTYLAEGGEMTESFGLCGTATVEHLAESEENPLASGVHVFGGGASASFPRSATGGRRCLTR